MARPLPVAVSRTDVGCWSRGFVSGITPFGSRPDLARVVGGRRRNLGCDEFSSVSILNLVGRRGRRDRSVGEVGGQPKSGSSHTRQVGSPTGVSLLVPLARAGHTGSALTLTLQVLAALAGAGALGLSGLLLGRCRGTDHWGLGCWGAGSLQSGIAYGRGLREASYRALRR